MKTVKKFTAAEKEFATKSLGIALSVVGVMMLCAVIIPYLGIFVGTFGILVLFCGLGLLAAGSHDANGGTGR